MQYICMYMYRLCRAASADRMVGWAVGILPHDLSIPGFSEGRQLLLKERKRFIPTTHHAAKDDITMGERAAARTNKMLNKRHG